jgi:hypothetical protein
MLRKYNKTLTVALTAIALATASLAATSDAFAGGGGKGGGGREGWRRRLGPPSSSSRLWRVLCRRRRNLLVVGAWHPGQHLLLILRLMEHPPDVFVLGRVFYAHMADKRGSCASPFSG